MEIMFYIGFDKFNYRKYKSEICDIILYVIWFVFMVIVLVFFVLLY